MRKIYIIFIFLTLLIGGGEKRLPASNAIETINVYRAKPSQVPPTIKDFEEAGVAGITKDNIAKVNERIAYINTHPTAHIQPFNYDTKRDYLYNFTHADAKKYLLRLKKSKIFLGDINVEKNSTSLLKFRIKTTTIGHYFEPKITTIANGISCNQTFEPMANGVRYLNLSSLDLNKSHVVRLNSQYAVIDDQDVELLIFEHENLKREKIMIIAPHPDDAEIAAYGLYSQNHENTYIVTMTAGDAGPHRYYDQIFSSRKEQYLEKGRIRTFDSLTVPLLGNVPIENIVNLGFFDGTLKKMYDFKKEEIKSLYIDTSDITTFRKQNISSLASGLSGGSNWSGLVENLAYLIVKIKPTIIVTPYPALDWHNDHKYSTIAVIEALKKLKRKEGKLFLYTNHLPASEYYPFGERGAPITLPPNYGNEIYFNSIYSYEVPSKIQAEKILALDKMSDILLDRRWSNLWNICEGKISFLCQDLSYFRRAVRQNEFFFVVDIENIYKEEVLESLLD